MAVDKISELVADKAFADLAKLEGALDANVVKFKEAVEVANQYNNTLGKSATPRDFVDNQVKASRAIGNVEQSTEKARLAEIRLQQARERSIDSYNKRLAQQEAAQRKATARTTEANREFVKLEQELKRLDKVAQDTGVAFGRYSLQFKEAADRANEVRDRVQGINRPLNNFKDNVGNYTNAIVSGFGKAFGAIRTVANILPGLGISGIFLAGFEGLKFLTEELGLFSSRTTAAQAILQSFNEVNKEASTEYGKQSTNLKILYGAAIDVNNSMEARLRAARELQKEFPTTFKNYTAEKIITGELKGAYDDLTGSLLANAQARASADKIAELAGKKQENEFQKAKIIAAFNAEQRRVRQAGGAVDAQNKQDSTEFDIFGQTEATVAAGNAFRKGVVQNEEEASRTRARNALREVDANNKLLDSQIQFLTKYAGGRNKIASALSEGTGDTPTIKDTTEKDRLAAINALIESEKVRNQLVQENDKSSYQERLKSTATFLAQSIEYIKQRESIELESANLTEAAHKAIVQKAENDIDRIRLDSNNQNEKLQSEVNKRYEDEQKELYRSLTAREKALLATYEAASTERLQVIEREKADYIAQITTQYTAGEISAETYNQKLYDIEVATTQKRLELQIEAARKAIETQAAALAFGIGSSEDLQKSTDALTKLQIQKIDEVTKADIKSKKDREEAAKRLQEKEIELATAAGQLIQTVIQGRYQAELDAITQQSDAIDKQSEKDKSAVDRSLLSSQQKADKNALIDAQAQSKKEALAEREKEIKRNAAIADRAFNIASIIQNTAVAISKTLAQGGILFSPLVGVIAAIGAVQIATVLATPLPKFRGGVKGWRGGDAIIGDGGSEIARLPDGRMYLSPNTDTRVSLPAGSDVFTHAETMRMLAKPDVRVMAGNDGDGGMREVVAAVERTGKKTVAAMSRSSKVQVNGWMSESKQAEKWGRIYANYKKN